MKVFLIAIAAAVVIGILLWQCPREQESSSLLPAAVGREPEPESLAVLGDADPVRQDVAEQAPEAGLIPWQEYPDFDSEFPKRFSECFTGPFGQSGARGRSQDRTKENRDTASGTRLSEIIQRYENSDLAVRNVAAELYATLISGGQEIAANHLSNHMQYQSEWLQGRASESYEWPERHFLRRALRYPPEMLVSYWADRPRESLPISADLAERLARLRDESNVQYCSVYQEQFEMGSCLALTARALGVKIPPGEATELYRRLIPEYRRTLEEMTRIQENYLNEIRALMILDGMAVAR